jgi:hypothetical protein
MPGTPASRVARIQRASDVAHVDATDAEAELILAVIGNAICRLLTRDRLAPPRRSRLRWSPRDISPRAGVTRYPVPDPQSAAASGSRSRPSAPNRQA